MPKPAREALAGFLDLLNLLVKSDKIELELLCDCCGSVAIGLLHEIYWEMKMSIKRWQIDEKNGGKSKTLGKETGLPAIVCDVLLSRGYQTSEEVQAFLSDEIAFESPFALKDMDKAVERIETALQNDETIAIYGDYDCDGITATAVLMSYFQAVGGDVFYYIPNRETEGYGLNKKALDVIKANKATLVVTVDNGITAHAEVDYAMSIGLDIVVTDHHTPRETLPQAVAVVNPHRADCPSQFKDFAGVGVAFQLVCALEGAETWEMLELYADLVTIGTIADIVPLVGENRAMVRFGLEALRNTTRPGIQALFQIGNISTEKAFTTDSVAFGLAPRLNAAGRMGQVRDAVELLITDDTTQATELADKLQEYNLQRRRIEEDILLEVEDLILRNPDLIKNRVIVVSGRDWHPGVMGIVASRLLDQYGKPCLVFSQKGLESSGSGRSIEGFDLIDAIHACGEKLIHYGGHTMAAGATLLTKDLLFFTTQLQEYAAKKYDIMPVPNLHAAAALEGSQLTLENVRALDVIGPFGCANEAPLFALKQVEILGVHPTRDGNHMRLKLNAQGQIFTAIYFRMAENAFPYQVGDKVDAIVALEISLWNEAEQLSVRVEDLRSGNLPQDQVIAQQELYQRHCRGERTKEQNRQLLPNREQLALVFRYLREVGEFSYGSMALYERFSEEKIPYGTLRIALDALEELGLIAVNGNAIQISPEITKVNLEDSHTLQSLQA